MPTKANEIDASQADLRQLAEMLRMFASAIDDAADTIGEKTIPLAIKSFQDTTLGERVNGFVNSVEREAKKIRNEAISIRTAAKAKRTKKKT